MNRGKPLERRVGLKRNKALERSAKPLRRTEMKRSAVPIAQMSEKTRKLLKARRHCREVVTDRDRTCQFWPLLARWNLDNGAATLTDPEDGTRVIVNLWKDEPYPPRCSKRLDVHEPGKRSHMADPTDPDQCILVCRRHHRWSHLHPRVAEMLGLLVRSGKTTAAARRRVT